MLILVEAADAMRGPVLDCGEAVRDVSPAAAGVLECSVREPCAEEVAVPGLPLVGVGGLLPASMAGVGGLLPATLVGVGGLLPATLVGVGGLLPAGLLPVSMAGVGGLLPVLAVLGGCGVSRLPGDAAG